MSVSIEIPRGTYYSITDAAEAVGVTTGRLRQLIRADKLIGIKISERAWLIPKREVTRLKKSGSKLGRPRSAAVDK